MKSPGSPIRSFSQLVYHPGVYEWQSASMDFRFPQYGDGSYVVQK